MRKTLDNDEKRRGNIVLRSVSKHEFSQQM